MRRNSPQTARADSQEEVAMRYDDVRFVSKTAEEHERDAYGSTFLTGEEARKILAAHKVSGRSKLDADAARDMASEQWPDEVRAVREAKVYAAGAAYRAESHAVRIRISFDDMADARAANEVYERLREMFECTPASIYDRRRGGRALYFEAIVPKGPAPAE